jgi:hypothetical protein
MRRLFVIFLALLFPLNVFALSMSVSAMQASGMSPYIHAPAPVEVASFSSDAHSINPHSVDSPVSEALCDIDPDEPPAGMDFHDTVHAAAQLPFAAPPDASVPSFVPSRRGRDPLPPIKPPPSV